MRPEGATFSSSVIRPSRSATRSSTDAPDVAVRSRHSCRLDGHRAVVAVLRRDGDGDGAGAGRPHDGQRASVVRVVRRRRRRSPRCTGCRCRSPGAPRVRRRRRSPAGPRRVHVAVGVDQRDVDVREVAIGGVDARRGRPARRAAPGPSPRPAPRDRSRCRRGTPPRPARRACTWSRTRRRTDRSRRPQRDRRASPFTSSSTSSASAYTSTVTACPSKPGHDHDAIASVNDQPPPERRRLAVVLGRPHREVRACRADPTRSPASTRPAGGSR